MSRFLAIAFALIGLFAIVPADARSQQVNSSTVIQAPQWRVGQWWRVRTALITGGAKSDDMRPSPQMRDSKTAFIVYRYTVLGQKTLEYEDQDERRHVGQATPPEKCWVLKVSAEPGTNVTPEQITLRIYLRIEDLSVREIAYEGPKSSQDYFIYTGTVIDDDQNHPIVRKRRGPLIIELSPGLVWAWPKFPISIGSNGNTANQTASAAANGLNVAFGPPGSKPVSKVDTVHQTWLPGMPWWTSSDIGGLRESKLIETSDHSVASREKP